MKLIKFEAQRKQKKITGKFGKRRTWRQSTNKDHKISNTTFDYVRKSTATPN